MATELADIAGRKEFRDLLWAAGRDGDLAVAGFGREGTAPSIPFAFHGAQLFVQAFARPTSPYHRLLLFWQTGSGKTLAVIAISQKFIRRARIASVAGRRAPGVTVIAAPGVRNLVVRELLNRPELGYISWAEREDLRRLEAAVARSPGDATRQTTLSARRGALKQRVTNRARGGLYRFYGYQELANALIRVTARGVEAGVTLERLLSGERPQKSASGGAGRKSKAAPRKAAPKKAAPKKAAPKKAAPNKDLADAPHEIPEEEIEELATPPEATAGEIIERVEAAAARREVELDRELLDSFRDELLVVDEAQNAYNMRAANNYGVVVAFILRHHGEGRCRALFLSATPLTGAAAEAVDLAALLTGTPQRRENFVERAADGTQRLKPGRAEILGRLMTPRVSFLLDPGLSEYPRVIDKGEPITWGGEPIPYIQFTPAAALPAQKAAFENLQGQVEGSVEPSDSQWRKHVSTVPPDLIGLLDAAFPVLAKQGPDEEFIRGDPAAAYLRVPPKTLQAAGFEVIITRGRVPVIGGKSLRLEGKLPEISPKYAALMTDLLNSFKLGDTRRGKAFIYHDRVRGTGVLLIAEILRANGFIPEDGAPGPGTRCALCGVVQKSHQKKGDHSFAPARFAVAHYLLEAGGLQRIVERFNDPLNDDGSRIRVLVGARVLQVGWTFRAVRFLAITSLPLDIPRLIQVRGRVVRRGTHASLPPDERTVTIQVYITTPSPEVGRYSRKAAAFLEIQEVERAMRRNAVDAAPQLADALASGHSHPLLVEGETQKSTVTPSLAGLPVTPVASARASTTRLTYDADGFAERDIAIAGSAVAALFRVRPVWDRNDLVEAVRTPGTVGQLAVKFDVGSPHNFAPAGRKSSSCDEDTILAAIERTIVAGRIVSAPPYLIAREYYGPSGFIARLGERNEPADVVVPIDAGSLSSSRSEKWTWLPGLLARTDDPPYLFVAQEPVARQFALVRRIVEESWGEKGDLDLSRLARAYQKFGVLLYASKNKDAAAYVTEAADPRARPVGYLEGDAAAVYIRGSGGGSHRWVKIFRRDVAIPPAPPENNIVIGFSEERRGALKFKIRQPLQQLRASGHGAVDARTLARGGVCATRPRVDVSRALAATSREMGVSSKQRGPLSTESVPSLCRRLMRTLMELEMRDRMGARSRARRWMYLFNERPPSLAEMAGQVQT